MSVIWNGDLIVDRKLKPRNYSELIEITNFLKSEIGYQIKQKLQNDKELVLNEVRMKKEMAIAKSRGFSQDPGGKESGIRF